MNPNRPTPRHVIIKMATVKGRILKAAREKQRVNYKRTPIRLSANFSTEMSQARREFQSSKMEKSVIWDTLPSKTII